MIEKILANAKVKIGIILTLFLISVFLSKFAWYEFGSILQFGDWGYRFDEYGKNLFLEWGSWNSAFQFGASNITLFGYPVRGLIWSGLVNVGLSYQDALRLALFIPLAITAFVSPYIFVLYKTKNHLTAAVLAFFYSSIPYFLVTITAHLPISLVFALTPLLLVLLEQALKTNKFTWWIVFIISFCICASHDIRIAFLAALILILYFLFLYFQQAGGLKKVWQALTVSVLILFLQAYWLLVIIFQGSSSIQQVADRGIFGDHLFDVLHALTLSKWNWTGAAIDWNFQLMPVPLYLFFIPALVFSAYFVLLQKYRQDKFLVIFFGILSLLGIFLTKQSAYPIPTAYQWLYENFPTFNLYREASKLFIFTSIGYLGILTLFFKYLQINKKKNFYFYGLVLLTTISLLNFKPFITKEIGSLFIKRLVPENYTHFNEHFSACNRTSFYRTAWVPRSSNWVLNGFKCPRVDLVYALDEGLYPFVDSGLPIDPNKYVPRITNFLNKNFTNQILDVASIKYLGIPLQDVQNDDEFFIHFGGKEDPNIREWYIAQLDALPYLKRVDVGTSELVVYENEGYKPYIFPFTSLAHFDSTKKLEQKYTFLSDTLAHDFLFTTPNPSSGGGSDPPLTEPTAPTLAEGGLTPLGSTAVRGLFEDLSVDHVRSDRLIATLNTSRYGYLYFPSRILNAAAQTGSDLISISPRASTTAVRNPTLRTIYSKIPLTERDSYTFEFTHPAHAFTNAIENPSFESGFWTKEVGDCHDYDDNPILSMRANTAEKTDGARSLELQSERHIACTNIDVSVTPNQKYLLSFDYQSPNADRAGYYLSFDDETGTDVSERIPIEDKSWHTYTKEIVAPADATSARLYVYSYATNNKTNIITRYDNFHLIPLPDGLDDLWLVSSPIPQDSVRGNPLPTSPLKGGGASTTSTTAATSSASSSAPLLQTKNDQLQTPRSVDFNILSPTKKHVTVKGAATPFYLAMSESYHDKWQLMLRNHKIEGGLRSWIPFITPDALPDSHHFRLNTFLNGWYVDPSSLCAEGGLTPLRSPLDGCTKNADGSYDLNLTIEFIPQRWFYLGLLISGLTFLGCLSYLTYSLLRRPLREGGLTPLSKEYR